MESGSKLIINADDFGYTMGVTHGIISAHLNGVVTSTTALTVSEYFYSAMELSEKFPSLKIGVHLTLTFNKAKPILGKEVPSLIQEDGTFWNQEVFLEKINLEEVEREWFAQVQKFYDSGYIPTHIDSHHGVHRKTEELLEIALRIAKHYDLPLRSCSRSKEFEYMEKFYREANVRTTKKIYSSFYGKNISLDTISLIAVQIRENGNGIYEMNCHPGFIDNDLINTSNYVRERIDEYDALTSDDIKAIFKEKNIELTSFEELGKYKGERK